jgi:hypothetical protein
VKPADVVPPLDAVNDAAKDAVRPTAVSEAPASQPVTSEAPKSE